MLELNPSASECGIMGNMLMRWSLSSGYTYLCLVYLHKVKSSQLKIQSEEGEGDKTWSEIWMESEQLLKSESGVNQINDGFNKCFCIYSKLSWN